MAIKWEDIMPIDPLSYTSLCATLSTQVVCSTQSICSSVSTEFYPGMALPSYPSFQYKRPNPLSYDATMRAIRQYLHALGDYDISEDPTDLCYTIYSRTGARMKITRQIVLNAKSPLEIAQIVEHCVAQIEEENARQQWGPILNKKSKAKKKKADPEDYSLPKGRMIKLEED